MRGFSGWNLVEEIHLEWAFKIFMGCLLLLLSSQALQKMINILITTKNLLYISIFMTRDDDIIMMRKSSDNIIFTIKAHSFSHFDSIEKFYGMILRTSDNSFRSCPNQLSNFIKMNFRRTLRSQSSNFLLNFLLGVLL